MLQKTLLLHFDLNQTILIQDKVSNRTLEHLVNAIVADLAYGRVEDGQWKLAKEELLESSPDPELMTYYEYVDSILPFPPLGDDPERKAKVQKIQQQKYDLRDSFTLPHREGAVLRPHYERIVEALYYSDATRGGARTPYSLVPAFFRTIIELAAANRDFHVSFRTFGTDSEDIVREFNGWCEGKHPCYPHVRFDGTNGTRDLRVLSKRQTGVFYRHGKSSDESYLIVGTYETVKNHEEGIKFYDEKEGIEIIQGFAKIYEFLSTQKSTFSFREYFPFWRLYSNESHGSGKLVLVNPRDTHVHSIFLDDNIEYGKEKTIVDVRFLTEGNGAPTCMDDSKHRDVYSVRVLPHLVATNESYFLDVIKRCESNLAANDCKF